MSKCVCPECLEQFLKDAEQLDTLFSGRQISEVLNTIALYTGMQISVQNKDSFSNAVLDVGTFGGKMLESIEMFFSHPSVLAKANVEPVQPTSKSLN